MARPCPWQLIAVIAAGWAVVKGAAQSLMQNGDSTCPCANATALGAAAAGLPLGFGINCSTHFMLASAVSFSAACQNSEPYSWCNNSWCFVDPDNCELPTTFMGSPPLYYSYPTCGFLDTMAPQLLAQQLQGEVIRVVYLNNTAGLSGSYFFGSWRGPTFDYMKLLLENTKARVNLTMELKVSPWPNRSLPWPAAMMRQFREDYPTSQSIFDSCVYATGMGFVDLCVGAFTVNEARVKISRMIEYFQVDVRLVVNQSLAQSTLADRVASAWAPFSAGLWVMIFGVVAGASLLIAVHERVDNPEPPQLRRRATYVDCGTSAAFQLYNGWQSYFGGGLPPTEPVSLAGRLTSMGLAVFILMSVSAYTANMAAFLVQQQTATSDISSVQDIIDNPSYKICCEAQLVDSFASKLGVPREQIVGFPSRGSILPSLDASKCNAAGVYSEDLDQAHSQGLFCTYQDVQFLLTVGQGVSVSEKVARALEWGHKFLDKSGTFDGLLKKIKESNKNTCPKIDASNGDGVLGAEALLGALVATVTFSAAGVLISLAKVLMRVPRFKRNDVQIVKKQELEGNEEDYNDQESRHASDMEGLRRRLDGIAARLDILAGKPWA